LWNFTIYFVEILANSITSGLYQVLINLGRGNSKKKIWYANLFRQNFAFLAKIFIKNNLTYILAREERVDGQKYRIIIFMIRYFSLNGLPNKKMWFANTSIISSLFSLEKIKVTNVLKTYVKQKYAHIWKFWKYFWPKYRNLMTVFFFENSKNGLNPKGNLTGYEINKP